MSEREDTTPGIQPVGTPPAAPPPAAPGYGTGSPGYSTGPVGRVQGGPTYSTGPVGGSGAHGYAAANENYYTTPQYTTQPVARRRPDVIAGLLLLLAGAA